MGCLISCIACCFCNAAASLCCACMPSCKNSTSTRLVNGLILIFLTVISSLILIPEINSLFMKINQFCPDQSTCQAYASVSAIYRFCFACALFYCFMSVFTIRVKSSKDPRSYLHNGFWFFKVCIIVGTIIGAFFIKDPVFLSTWYIFGMIGGSIYIVIQLILLVDFAHTWNSIWVDAYENSNSKIYTFLLLFTTIVFYATSIAAVVLFYLYYANNDQCSLSKMLISLNLIGCFIISVVSILPRIQEGTPQSGLLQSSIVTVYVMFLTWSALTHFPNFKCNPFITPTNINSTTGTESILVVTYNWHTALSLIFLVISLVYACIRTSSHTTVGRLTFAGGEDISNAENGPPPEKKDSGQTVWDNESDGVAYSYCVFNLMMFLAIMYMMMSVTQWYKPLSAGDLVGPNLNTFWVKTVSSWVCILVYVWTLIAPIIFPDRVFS